AAWSDTLLTPAELRTLKDFIEQQPWLSSEDKRVLLDQLNPSSPPRPDEYKSWLAEIRAVLDPEKPDKQASLVDIGMKLAQLRSNGSDISQLEASKDSLQKMIETLGFISTESF